MIQAFTRKILSCIHVLLLSLAVLAGQTSVAQTAPPPPQPELQELQVNINEADAETIADILVGIGASRARAIVEYREENGRFNTLEDLTRVVGVGEATVRNNQERIRFE
jgi:competence protein ComEA